MQLSRLCNDLKAITGLEKLADPWQAPFQVYLPSGLEQGYKLRLDLTQQIPVTYRQALQVWLFPHVPVNSTAGWSSYIRVLTCFTQQLTWHEGRHWQATSTCLKSCRGQTSPAHVALSDRERAHSQASIASQADTVCPSMGQVPAN